MCHVDSERNCGTWGVGWLHFSILALPSFLSTFCKELWTLCIGCIGLFCFLFLILYIYIHISTFIFKLFLNGIIGLRCSMVTFVYLIFTFFLSNFWKELRTSGVGWLHDSILSPPSFLSTFCKELRTSSVGWLHLSILVLPAFSNTFCKELWTSDIGWLHPHKDTSQTVYKLLADI